MNKQIIIAITLCMMFVGFASADATIGIDSGSGDVTLPLYVTNGTNVGSMHFNMTYDPNVVTVTGVADGNADNMLANLEHADDGYVRIIAYQSSSPGLTGDFNVAYVTFKSIGNSVTCPVNIDVVTFKDSTPVGNKMAYTVSNATYTAVGGSGRHGGGGTGTYPPESMTNVESVKSGKTSESSPTLVPTLNLPGGGISQDLGNQGYAEKDLTSIGKIIMAIIGLAIALVAIIVKMRKGKK